MRWRGRRCGGGIVTKKEKGQPGRRRLTLIKMMTLYNSSDSSHNLRDKMVNACILAGLAFFKTLVALMGAGVLTGTQAVLENPAVFLVSGGITAGLEFFTYLAVAKGLTLSEIGRPPEKG